MIDTAIETLVPIYDAPQHIPGRPHFSTVVRWASKGTRGKRLATVLVGGRRYTSVEAIKRFLDAGLSDPKQEPADDRSRRASEAGRALEAIGA